MISRTCVIYSVTQMNLSLKKKQNHEHREQTGSCQAEERDAEVGISRRKLSYREWINNTVLLYSTETYIQCPMISHETL